MVSQALAVRKELIGDMLRLAEDASLRLDPIVRPMWWLDPQDPATFEIYDQFALGDDVIVAPVVVKGQRQREVYLTAGTWEDLADPGRIIQGRQWLTVDAPLAKLPCYRRVART
mmetsp:Transcript_12341/g.31273  ORF Transcript_12341/g.31273 Transcript_12341/m.31273 type:complete len:114 (-) Transcript_12341:234-575(-)